MAEIKFPGSHITDDGITLGGSNSLVYKAIDLVPSSQRSHVKHEIGDECEYFKGPVDELKPLVPFIKKVLTDHANWLLSVAEELTINETETKE